MKLIVTVGHHVNFDNEVLNLVIPAVSYFKSIDLSQSQEFNNKIGKLVDANAGYSAFHFVLDKGRKIIGIDEWYDIIVRIVVVKHRLTVQLVAEHANHYFKDGKLHREDGPAIEIPDGKNGWYFEGKRHSLTAPAYEAVDGTKVWYKHDQLHREDGPAFEWDNGINEWYLNGLRHREDGPAVERPNGYKAWYINDKKHRTDGPAVEQNGNKEWYLNGLRHREDGPAYEAAKGHKVWYVNGKNHRIGGPAVVWGSGYNGSHSGNAGPDRYYINGNQIPNNEIPLTGSDWDNAISKYS